MGDRPVCPKCGRPTVVVASRPDSDLRTQYLGCPECRVYNAGTQVIALSDRRTRINRAVKETR